MTPDPSADLTENQHKAPSTDGLTTKVVKGSLWTLAGQILPTAVAFFTAPFVIRFLGAEGYGVLILVGLIPAYLGFADCGMCVASTKFGSEAYAGGSREDEAKIVRTAGFIALLTSVPVAAALFLLSNTIILLFNVPEHLRSDAGLALRFASITFVVGLLNGIFNTPQLTRLRMDLNSFVNTGFRVLALVLVPVILYLGGGIAGAVFVMMAASLLTLLAHIIVSAKLLPELLQLTVNRSFVKPLLKFGWAVAVAAIAGILLVNTEKAILSATVSVTALAHYSVAFTLAQMLTLFSSAMVQSLLPAFSQLQSAENREMLSALYSRCIRITLIWLIPSLVFLSIAAKPFFTIWAGAEFGRESPLPFYILLGGLVFNVVAYVPFAAIMASGRSDIFAKLYWLELVPYVLLVAWLTTQFGAKGAAAAWSIRVIVDAGMLLFMAKKIGGVSYSQRNLWPFVIACLIMILPFGSILYFGELNPIVAALTMTSTVIYAFLVWKIVIENDEKAWLHNILNGFFNKRA